MSCISLSVGLGNVWRFPFTALENGGGAFIIPYLIVLFVVGKPVYYLEMLIGQFSSRGSIRVYDFSPAMRGKDINYEIIELSIFGRVMYVCMFCIGRYRRRSGVVHCSSHIVLCVAVGSDNSLPNRFDERHSAVE